jgi:mitochondrial import receptor subunit TOM40
VVILSGTSFFRYNSTVRIVWEGRREHTKDRPVSRKNGFDVTRHSIQSKWVRVVHLAADGQAWSFCGAHRSLLSSFHLYHLAPAPRGNGGSQSIQTAANSVNHSLVATIELAYRFHKYRSYIQTQLLSLVNMGATGSKVEQQQRQGSSFPPTAISFFSQPTTTQCDDSSAPPPPPPPGSDPSSQSLPLDSPSSNEDAIAKAAATASAYSPPGPYEQASNDAKRLVMLDTHDGFRCDINKQLSPYMAVVHSFWLGTSMLPDGRNRTYTWLTQVADESSFYMARVDPDRQSVDGRIHKALLGGLIQTKLQIGVSPEGQSDQMLAEADLNGMTWSANVKYGSVAGGLMYGCNYYQAITPKFSMGGEGLYIGVNNALAASYVLKYSIPAVGDEPLSKRPGPPGMPAPEAPSSTIVASFNPNQGLTLNYKRVVSPQRVTLGAELNANPMSLESTVVLGAEFAWSRSKLGVTLDGTGKMQSVLETKLGKEPGQPKLSLCAELDHMKDEMRFGYGLSIDG